MSTGNIIVIEREGGKIRGKLSDLEYAKEFNSKARSSDPKTVCCLYFVTSVFDINLQGTPYFMPWEIHASERLYVGDVVEPPDIGEFNSFLFEPQSQEDNGKPPPPRFRFQHDLESLWWVALWIVLCRTKHPKALEVADVVFTYNEIPTPDRRRLFTNKAFAPFLTSIIPAEISPLVGGLDNIRAMLHFSYVDAGFSGDNTVISNVKRYSGIYQKVWSGFSSLLVHAEGISYDFDDSTVNATAGTNDTTKTTLHKRPRPEPKRKDNAEYIPSPDHSDEPDEDSVDEREAKESKSKGVKKQRLMQQD